MKIIISLLIIIFSIAPITVHGATNTESQKELEIMIENINETLDSVHNTANQLRILGFDEESEELESLKSLWSSLYDEQNILQKQLEEMQIGEYMGVFITTAYCGQCDGSGTTSTGVKPVVGTTIAVDPKVIPYGTVLRLEDMDGNFLGYRIAQDTGGDIKNNRLDIFLENKQDCYNWGRREIKVYIIK